MWRRTSWKVWPGAGGGVTNVMMSRVTVTRPRASQDTAIIPSHTRTEGHTSRFHLDKFVLNYRSENRWKILSWTIWTPLVMIPNVHLTHCLWLQCSALSLGYVIIVSLSPHNFSLMEVQRVCFNINNVFPLHQKLCGQFYLHQVFVLGMLLMKLLYTRRFCGNVNSAKLRSCAKTSLTPVTRIHCNIVTGRVVWCNLHQGPHIPVQLPANKSNNYRLCAAINLHKSAGIFRLNPNPFARVNSRDCSSNLPPQCLNGQSKQLIKTLPSPSPTPPPPQRNIQKNK